MNRNPGQLMLIDKSNKRALMLMGALRSSFTSSAPEGEFLGCCSDIFNHRRYGAVLRKGIVTKNTDRAVLCDVV